MMKVQVRDFGEDLNLQVCGRVTGCWVDELERCWRAASETHPHQKLSVDLRGVTFIDQAGEQLLKSMYRQGASFQATGLLIQEIVDQITGSSK